MDRMDKTIFKTMFAGAFGTGQAWFTILESSQFGQLVSNILRLASLLVAILSGIYIVCLWRNRNLSKMLDVVVKEGALCRVCSTGNEPPGKSCIVPSGHRPINCPKELRRNLREQKLSWWKRALARFTTLTQSDSSIK